MDIVIGKEIVSILISYNCHHMIFKMCHFKYCTYGIGILNIHKILKKFGVGIKIITISFR
jgi:hypothetical protein